MLIGGIPISLSFLRKHSLLQSRLMIPNSRLRHYRRSLLCSGSQSDGSSSSTEQCSVYEIVEEEPQVSGDVDNKSKDRRRQQNRR